MATPTAVTVTVHVGGKDISDDVIYAQTTFNLSASALPGTCSIGVRDPNKTHSFDEGSVIDLHIDDGTENVRMWRGFLFDLGMDYVFEDDASVRRWTLDGVDLNILLDKMIMYNHSHPTRYPDGGGTYKRKKVINPKTGETAGFQVVVPKRTYDGPYIRAMLKDFDIGLATVKIKKNKIESVGVINPDGAFTPPSAGISLRDFLIDTSRNVQRSEPGSTIWYVDPDAFLVYRAQDRDVAPFWVGDGDTSEYIGNRQGENVRGLRIRRGISNIKDDVLVFAGALDPRPGSRQDRLRYAHKKNQSSIDKYGLFQYSESMPTSFLQSGLDARAAKIKNQEGTPGQSAEFTTFRPGLYPGQIIWVQSGAHGYLNNLPIRNISMSFPTPNIVEYRVSCSFDTQDPWGLLLALKKPPARGIKSPNFSVIDLRRNPNQTRPNPRRYTVVKEYPTSIGGKRYQCSYAYIRDSMTVYVGKLRQVSSQDPDTGTVGFLQVSPNSGQFKLGEDPTGGKRVYVEYHVSHDL